MVTHRAVHPTVDSPNTPIIFGHPWLLQHNPHLDWVNNSVFDWNLSCHASCPGAAHLFCRWRWLIWRGFRWSTVPWSAIFSKSPATSLPLHYPYDCAIDLLPDTLPLKGLFSLFMDKYICESMQGGLIRHSSSPDGFFSSFRRRTALCAPVLIIEVWLLKIL